MFIVNILDLLFVSFLISFFYLYQEHFFYSYIYVFCTIVAGLVTHREYEDSSSDLMISF